MHVFSRQKVQCLNKYFSYCIEDACSLMADEPICVAPEKKIIQFYLLSVQNIFFVGIQRGTSDKQIGSYLN